MSDVEKKIVIWGGGGHGHVVVDTLRALGDWSPVGIVDSVNPPGSIVMGLTVLGDADVLSSLREQGVEFLVVAVGNGAARERMTKQALELGFKLPTIIHPGAEVFPSAQIGVGTVVCAGATIGAQTSLGDGVIVNTRAVVDHDCMIGDFSHIAPAAVLCGVVQVGNRSWIGAGAIVRDHLNIGSDVVVGMGSVLVSDVSDGKTVYGNPAVERGDCVDE